MRNCARVNTLLAISVLSHSKGELTMRNCARVNLLAISVLSHSKGELAECAVRCCMRCQVLCWLSGEFTSRHVWECVAL